MPKLLTNQAVNRSWTSTLLSLFTTDEQADAIEGDLLEEAISFGKCWLVMQVGLTVLALFWHAVSKAPVVTVALSCVSLVMASILTMFLLLPFAFQLNGYGVFVMLFMLCSFRAVACFIVGAALVEYAPKVGTRSVVTGALLMLSILVCRLVLNNPQWGVLGEVVLGAAESIVFYVICSALPLVLGGIYSHRNRRSELEQIAIVG